jgi:hypothetical protein
MGVGDSARLYPLFMNELFGDEQASWLARGSNMGLYSCTGSFRVSSSQTLLNSHCPWRSTDVVYGFVPNQGGGDIMWPSVGLQAACFPRRSLVFRSRGSTVGIVTAYCLYDQMVWVRAPVWTIIFTSSYHSNRLRGPPSLLSSGYRGLYQGIMRQRLEAGHHLQQVARTRKLESKHPLPHTSTWHNA